MQAPPFSISYDPERLRFGSPAFDKNSRNRKKGCGNRPDQEKIF